MENEKQNLSLMLILAIFINLLSPLIFFFSQKNVSEGGRKLIIDTLNFELTIFIIMAIIAFVPIVNMLTILVGPVFFIVNLIVCISANNALNNNTPYNFPFGFSIIK